MIRPRVEAAGMNAEKIQSALLIAALVAVGAAAWWLQTRPSLEVDASALAALPRELGRWRSVDLPMEAAVESVLEADFNLQRAYYHLRGDPVWLYVGYYGTARGGRPEHSPRGCYTGAGWNIESSRKLQVAPGSKLRVNEYRVARGGERRLVHFWFRSHRRTGLLGGLDQNLDRLVGRLSQGRADGALVRVSTPLQGDELAPARSRLLSFAAELDPLLAKHWPSERTHSRGG
jgi:EpsI family protein